MTDAERPAAEPSASAPTEADQTGQRSPLSTVASTIADAASTIAGGARRMLA